MDFAYIRAMRHYYNESQFKFAIRLGTTPISISTWETGKNPPGVMALNALNLAKDGLRAKLGKDYLTIIETKANEIRKEKEKDGN